MNRYWPLLGNITFWLAWPVLYVYLGDTERTRVLIHHGNDVLVLKDWLGDGSWKLPGGGVRRGEDFAASAVREAHEETGLTIKAKRLRSLGPVESRSHGFRCRLHCFVVTLPERPEPTAKRKEITSVKWLPLADLLHKEKISLSTRIILERWYHGAF